VRRGRGACGGGVGACAGAPRLGGPGPFARPAAAAAVRSAPPSSPLSCAHAPPLLTTPAHPPCSYLLEQSLSVDNLFVFVLVFNYFKTPPEHQPKVLNYGILTAAVLRAVMVLLGYELVERFEPVLLLFAGVLLWSAWGLLTGDDDEDEDLSDNAVGGFYPGGGVRGGLGGETGVRVCAVSAPPGLRPSLLTPLPHASRHALLPKRSSSSAAACCP
jgi:hypothetical protein